jgi:hypothetical protein
MKTWFIAEASQGLGRECALAALERGDLVAVSAADPTALNEPPLRVVIGNNAVSPIVATDPPMTHEIPQSRTPSPANHSQSSTAETLSNAVLSGLRQCYGFPATPWGSCSRSVSTDQR